MPRWNSPKRHRSESSASPEPVRYETKKRFVSRSRSRERKRAPTQYNRSPSPRYRSDNRSKYDQPRKGSPIKKKQSNQMQRNRSYSPEDRYKDPPLKNKRRSIDGYRGGSLSPQPQRKRSVTPTKRRYDDDGKSRRKQNLSPERYDKRSGGKDSNRRDADDHHYKQSKRSRSRDGGKGYKRGRSRSASESPPRRAGSRGNQKHGSQSKYDNSSSSRKHHDIDPSEIRININAAKPSPPPRNIFNVEELVFPRRKDEGTKPLFDRPELRQRSYYDTQDNLDEERRVVSVKKTNDNIEYMQNMPVQDRNMKQHPMQQPVSNLNQFQSNTAMFQYSSLSNHDLGISGSKMNHNLYQQPQQNTYSQIDLQPHNVMQNNLQPGRNEPQMYDLPTGDLRHCLKSRRSPKDDRKEKMSRDGDYHPRSRSKSRQDSRKIKASPGNHTVNDRLRNIATSADQSHDKLPNFRKELEEIQRDEWKFDPTSIPRSDQYFEHDDRERRNTIDGKVSPLKSKNDFSKYRKRGSTTTSFRGFNRGSSFASRGFGARRGFAAARGGTSQGSTFFNNRGSKSSASWKHDMYDGKKGSKTLKSNDKFSSKRSSNPSRKDSDKRPSSSRK